jgi:hypothetical protein
MMPTSDAGALEILYLVRMGAVAQEERMETRRQLGENVLPRIS